MTRPQVVVAGGRSLRLERLVGRGGEGDVYAVADDPQHVVKLYTVADLAAREAKVMAMVQGDLATRAPLAAFPKAAVHSTAGRFAGFLMKLMSGYKPLHELYAPGPRKHHFPHADYRFLVRAATNIARAFANVHLSGCVVGDINHSGILVSDQATAALIDADSFQFTHQGRQFLCLVGVPEYTAPELQGRPLSGVVRTINHDAFGLAVVIFQMLLMGRHPFVGTVRKGDIPPLHENIQHFRYVYAENRNVGMDQPPGTPALSDFAPALAQLFDRAFSSTTADRRPTAQDWVASLEQLEAGLVPCDDNPLHYGPKDASDCAWCDMERRLDCFLFLPYLPRHAPPTPPADPHGASFDINVVWARVERLRLPALSQLRPMLSSLSPGPSLDAVAAKEPKTGGNAWGALWIVAGIVLLVMAPQVWVIAALLAGLGIVAVRSKPAPTVDASRFRRDFTDAQQRWTSELAGWHRRAGLHDIELLRETLSSVRQRYLDLAEQERRLVQEYRSQRRDRQLRTYLEAFDVAASPIRGIGPAKIATLGSYGIDTAADVTPARLTSVPGFGEVTTSKLMGWRRDLENRFVYNAHENDADRQELARIRAIAEGKAAPLRAQLSRGAHELEQRVSRMHAFAQQQDPALQRLHERLEQLRADLTFLGQTIPQPPAQPPARSPLTAGVTAPGHKAPGSRVPPSTTTTAPGPAPSVGTSSLLCPRCSSVMKRRLAKRGRNAGGYFWGCSRYPSCKGTRSI